MAAQFLEEVRAAAGEFYIAESEKKKWVEMEDIYLMINFLKPLYMMLQVII